MEKGEKKGKCHVKGEVVFLAPECASGNGEGVLRKRKENNHMGKVK